MKGSENILGAQANELRVEAGGEQAGAQAATRLRQDRQAPRRRHHGLDVTAAALGAVSEDRRLKVDSAGLKMPIGTLTKGRCGMGQDDDLGDSILTTAMLTGLSTMDPKFGTEWLALVTVLHDWMRDLLRAVAAEGGVDAFDHAAARLARIAEAQLATNEQLSEAFGVQIRNLLSTRVAAVRRELFP
jgi:hypothetical protein